MRFEFNSAMEMVEFDLEIWTGDHKEATHQQMPAIMAEQEMKQVAMQVMKQQQPMKIVLKRKFYLNNGELGDKEIIITNKSWDKAHATEESE